MAPAKAAGQRSMLYSQEAASLLARAYEQLSERKRTIEEELSRSGDLRKELDTINVQVESLKNIVELFGAAPSPSRAETKKEKEPNRTVATAETSTKGKATEFAGNRRDLVIEIVKAGGSAGVTPKDVAKVFSDRKIAKGRNLIYNLLGALVKEGKMKREDGRYIEDSSAAIENSVPAKRTLSAAGLKRIRDANKKRWAKVRSGVAAA